MVALQGKNYVYAVKSLFMPINVDGCHVAASKTKKNVLITLQVGFARLLADGSLAFCLQLPVLLQLWTLVMFPASFGCDLLSCTYHLPCAAAAEAAQRHAGGEALARPHSALRRPALGAQQSAHRCCCAGLRTQPPATSFRALAEAQYGCGDTHGGRIRAHPALQANWSWGAAAAAWRPHVLSAGLSAPSSTQRPGSQHHGENR